MGWQPCFRLKWVENSVPRVDCFDEVREKVESLLDYLKTSTMIGNSCVSHFWRQIFKIAGRRSEVPWAEVDTTRSYRDNCFNVQRKNCRAPSDWFSTFLFLNTCFDWLIDWFTYLFINILIDWLIDWVKNRGIILIQLNHYDSYAPLIVTFKSIIDQGELINELFIYLLFYSPHLLADLLMTLVMKSCKFITCMLLQPIELKINWWSIDRRH